VGSIELGQFIVLGFVVLGFVVLVLCSNEEQQAGRLAALLVVGSGTGSADRKGMRTASRGGAWICNAEARAFALP